MATNVNQWAAAGLKIMQVGVRGSGGNFAGAANLTAANTGTASGMRRIPGPVTAPNPVPNVNRVRNRGNDGYIATHLFETEPPDFDLETEANDQDAENMMISATTYALGEWDMSGRGVAIPTFRDIVTLLTRQAESEESGSEGNGYDNLLIMSSKYLPRQGQFSFQSATGATYPGNGNRVTKLPWGVTVSTAIGLGDAMTMEWWSEYPCTLVCFIGDGAITDVPLPFTPITAAKTKFFNFATAAALTVSSVNTSTDKAVLSAAPSSGLITVGIFETQDLVA